MADPHVAFGSGFSALGVGKLSQVDNELMEAPEDEDDFDVLNEETFGDIGDTDYDWEKQHERFAEVLEASSFSESRQNGETTKDSGFDTAEKSYRTQEEIMEQSITHLVLDEEDDRNMVDPAIVNVSTSSAIPFSSMREPHLEHLFGPSSPPAFLDTEHLVSPTSKNIWGSPARDSPFSKPVNNNLQALFDFAKGAGTNSSTQASTPSVIRAKPKTQGPLPHTQSPVVPPCAQTLAEIENQLLKKKGPTVMTAEELERQLRGESPPQHIHEKRTIATPGSVPPIAEHRSPFSMPIPIQPIGRPPMIPNFSQPPPGFSPMSRSIDGRVSPLTTRSMTPPVGGTSPAQHFSSPGMSSSPLTRSISPTPPPLGGTPIHRPPSPVHARLMSPFSSPAYSSPAAVLLGNANRGYSSPVLIPRGVRGPMPFGPMGSPGQRFPPHSPRGDPGHMMRGPPPVRAGYPHNNYYHKSPGPMHDNRQYGKNNNNPNRYVPDHRTRFDQPVDSGEDSYDGLMTQKEKDWIIKIQLMQLQTENPYLDDYYYTYFSLKKKAKERQRMRESGELSGGDDPKLVIPNLCKVETKAYTPAQFEGSLGRLTTASVHNPRTIIDLSTKKIPHPNEDGPQNVSKELRRVRQLLMDIEKGFLHLLDIDDLEKKLLALPEDSRMPSVLERREKVDQLFHFFSADENIETFIQTMSVRKGRKLLSRVLPLLDSAQACIMVSLMLCNLTQLMRKDQAEEGQSMLTESVNQALHKCSYEMLTTLSEQIQQMNVQGNAIAAMMQNKFGSTILCAMLQRAEDIYENTSPVDIDNQHETAWCQFVETFVKCLIELKADNLVSPLQKGNSLLQHLERLLNKKLVASVEDKLSVISDVRE